MIRLIFFDIDSTLLHTHNVGIHAFEKTLEHHFQVANGTKGLTFAGRTDTGLVREIFNKHGIETTPQNFQKFFDGYTTLLERMLPDCNGVLCPGAAGLIRGLQSLPDPPVIGLLTGNIKRGAELKLRHYNIWDHFVVGGFAEDSEDRNQIAAAALERGRSLLGADLRGDQTVVIGDTAHDVACGRAIGAKLVAVATGSTSLKELVLHKPDWAVEDLTKLTARDICPR